MLLAFLDKRERLHERCKAAVAEAPVPLATTTAVLTELFYFLITRSILVEAGWRTIRSGRIVVLPIGTEDLPALEALMIRYADRPMDFADATLVHVAAREGISTILTIDHDDFETYRIGRAGRFRILPAR